MREELIFLFCLFPFSCLQAVIYFALMTSGFALLVDLQSQFPEGFMNIYYSAHYLLRFSVFGCEHSLQFSASYSEVGNPR